MIHFIRAPWETIPFLAPSGFALYFLAFLLASHDANGTSVQSTAADRRSGRRRDGALDGANNDIITGRGDTAFLSNNAPIWLAQASDSLTSFGIQNHRPVCNGHGESANGQTSCSVDEAIVSALETDDLVHGKLPRLSAYFIYHKQDHHHPLCQYV